MHQLLAGILTVKTGGDHEFNGSRDDSLSGITLRNSTQGLLLRSSSAIEIKKDVGERKEQLCVLFNVRICGECTIRFDACSEVQRKRIGARGETVRRYVAVSCRPVLHSR